MTAFDALDAASAHACAAAFGERVRFLPMRPAGRMAAAGPDPDRAPRDLAGVLTIDHAVTRTDGDFSGGNFGPEMLVSPVRASLRKADFTDGPPRAGDRLQALDRPGQPFFEIVRAAPDNATRIVLHCAHCSAST